MLGVAVGVLLGLVFSVLGAGGGIIAVPALMLGFQLSMADATGAGLAVVFVAAATATAGQARAKRVAWRVVAIVAPTLMVGAAVGARLNRLLPERVTAGLFALVLVLATASLFLKKRDEPQKAPTVLLAGTGALLGVLTGVLGVGGGFLLVPVLVAFAQLPLHRAAGTSSALIMLGTLSGSVSALSARPELVSLSLPVAAGAMLGALAGVPLAGRLPERGLRLGFAALSLMVAVGMTFKALAA